MVEKLMREGIHAANLDLILVDLGLKDRIDIDCLDVPEVYQEKLNELSAAGYTEEDIEYALGLGEE